MAAAPPARLVDAIVAVAVAMATTERHRTLARYELSLAGAREPHLRAALVAGGDTIRAFAAPALAAAGAADPAAAAAELAALLDGLVFTALVRGPHDPAALAAWVRPPLERTLRAWTDARGRVAVHAGDPGFVTASCRSPHRRRVGAVERINAPSRPAPLASRP